LAQRDNRLAQSLYVGRGAERPGVVGAVVRKQRPSRGAFRKQRAGLGAVVEREPGCSGGGWLEQAGPSIITSRTLPNRMQEPP
jgi:hypothetical protein